FVVIISSGRRQTRFSLDWSSDVSSTYLNAERIRVTVIYFQGGLDAVVLPEQTESMVAALREHGVKVEYRLYPEERHGFRQAHHLADALKRECRFYQELLVEKSADCFKSGKQ